ncbi:MAG: GAF domain-containing protein [Acidobacteria bacterium]|nr:GAF domain-containing protein [Acidobacteriota bacterium]
MRLLLEVNNAVVSHLNLDDLFNAVSACLRKVIHHDSSGLVLCDQETGWFRVHVLHFEKNESFIEEGRVESDGCMKSPAAITVSTRKPAVFGAEDLKSLCPESPAARHLVAEGVKAFCSVPLLSHDRTLGALTVARCHEDAFSPQDIELLSEVAKQIAIAVENAQAYREITELKAEAVANGGDKIALPARLISMEEMERTHIEEVLRHTGGQIGGAGGAAEILGLPVSTLRSRMKKLGIRFARFAR